MRQLLLYVLLLLVASEVLAQQTNVAAQKHLVYFTDKKETPFSISQPQAFLSPKALARRQRQRIALSERDLPVNPSYAAQLTERGATVWYTSRWFNAAVVACSETQLNQLRGLPFVKSIYTLNAATPSLQQKQDLQKVMKLPFSSQAKLAPGNPEYGAAFHQANMLGTVDLHQAGFRGEGMLIAVLDAGFPEVHTIAAFAHLFEKEQLKGTFDFVQKSENVFGGNSHGTSVLSTIASYAPGTMLGTAYNANFLLLRTEDAATEHPIEEINWLLAAEYADSAGADVINSSLGYTLFDAPSKSYTYADMDGNTALISKAADMAAATGMLVVVSAGNEGNNTWKYISAPADADSVLAVGAVDSVGRKAPFSSFGPAADGRIKPDVAALGQRAYVLNASGKLGQGSGTSFAGPIMAGFATCLWQSNPGKTNYELIQLLHQLGSKAASPDSALGYGIPNYSRLITAIPALQDDASVIITNPVTQGDILLTLGEAWVQSPIAVKVYDMAGRLVFGQLLVASDTRQVLALKGRQLKQGLYICRLRSPKHTATLRFVRL